MVAGEVEPPQGPRDAAPDNRPLIADSATAMRSLAIRTPCLCLVLIIYFSSAIHSRYAICRRHVHFNSGCTLIQQQLIRVICDPDVNYPDNVTVIFSSVFQAVSFLKYTIRIYITLLSFILFSLLFLSPLFPYFSNASQCFMFIAQQTPDALVFKEEVGSTLQCT